MPEAAIVARVRDAPGQTQIVDKAVDVPVTMQNNFQQSSQIDSGCASPSVHRQSVGHSSYAAETVMHSA